MPHLRYLKEPGGGKVFNTGHCRKTSPLQHWSNSSAPVEQCPRCDHRVLVSGDTVTQMYTPASLADVPGDLLCKNMEVSLEKELQNYKIQTHEHVFLGSLHLI